MQSIGEKNNKHGEEGQDSIPRRTPDNAREGKGENEKNIRQSFIHGEIRVAYSKLIQKL